MPSCGKYILVYWHTTAPKIRRRLEEINSYSTNFMRYCDGSFVYIELSHKRSWISSNFWCDCVSLRLYNKFPLKNNVTIIKQYILGI